MRRKDEPSVGSGVPVDHIAHAREVTSALFQEVTIQMIQICHTRVEGLPAAAATIEVGRGDQLRPRSWAMKGVRKRPERCLVNELSKGPGVCRDRVVKIVRRRGPRMTVRERVTTQFVTLVPKLCQVARRKDTTHGRILPHETESRVIRSADPVTSQDLSAGSQRRYREIVERKRNQRAAVAKRYWSPEEIPRQVSRIEAAPSCKCVRGIHPCSRSATSILTIPSSGIGCFLSNTNDTTPSDSPCFVNPTSSNAFPHAAFLAVGR